MAGSWLDDLNEAQRQAVTHGDGPLLVVAGAGTGKTKTLACRVVYLIEQGVRPEGILLLTFTRRAAAEMLSRAGRICEQSVAGHVWGGTFHAVANRLLRMYGRGIGLAGDFTVMDQGDAADLMSLIRGELGLGKGKRRFPQKDTLVRIYSHTVNAQRKLEEVVARHFPWCGEDLDGMRQIFEQYVRRKREHNVLDYDDLLLHWNVLCTAQATARQVSDRFDHVLVDEYQDTNPIQARILIGLRAKQKNIMVVGDDAQSIYSFRAATVRNILDFPTQFPGTRQVTLEENYRSTQPILAASNAVMSEARERFTKELWSQRLSTRKPVLYTCLDEEDQCNVVCERILEHLEDGIPLHEQAVLFRAGHHSARLEIELTRRNMPFHKFGGLKFVETAHVKDMIAFLRILENPFDQLSWYRLLQMIEGIGPKTARRIMDQLGVRRELPGPEGEAAEGNGGGDSKLKTPLGRLLHDPPTVSPAAKEQFGLLRATVADCLGVQIGTDTGRPEGEAESVAGPPQRAGGARGEQLPVAAQVERIQAYYAPIFDRRYDNPAPRLRDLEQLAQIASGYRSRGRFITDLTLDPPNSTSDLAQPPYLEEDYLILSTIHAAKGCEWTVVHIIHAADGMIPSDMAVGDEEGVDEERRLFYVAMTRAKDHLYIYFPLRYYHRRFGFGDAHNYAQLSRFVPRAHLGLFEQRSGRPAESEGATRHASTRDVDDLLNSLWGE